MTTLYGIRNCDTCRKALRWLKARGMDVIFHDLRRDGVPAARLQHWLDTVGPESLINRRSATWRKLRDDDRARADAAPLELLQEQSTLIRRPVLEHEGHVVVGFREADYVDALAGEQS